jgi:hypothetical protein
LNRNYAKRIKDEMVDAAGAQIKSKISNLFALGHA